MYEIALKDFRGFHSTNFVEIRPITLLIGENSAGKSSFLAALKFALDFIAADEEPSFNKDPFQLGTFQQIAHYRGGKAGRAREFRISIRASVTPRRRVKAVPATFVLSFTNADSQATIESIGVSGGNGETLVARIEGDRLGLSLDTGSREPLILSKEESFPRVFRTEFARYWPFLLRELRYRIQRSSRDGPELPLDNDADERAASLGELAQALSTHLRGRVEATSAIRTKPLRTYTPGTEVRDGEGSHVPFEMAKLYRARSKEAWRRIKTSIEEFGKTSDMFRELNIKAFGKSASDPFQLQFSYEGPKTNIVDLGYGTSQVLPILYDVSSAPDGTKFLIQQPEVHLHPRAQAALGSYFVDSYKRHRKHFILETHSDYVVDRVRQAIAAGNLLTSDVSILFFERRRLENIITRIELDTDGKPVDAPQNYRSFFIDEQMRLLGL